MAGLVEFFVSEKPPVDGGQDQGKAPDMMNDLFGEKVMDPVRAGTSLDQAG